MSEQAEVARCPVCRLMLTSGEACPSHGAAPLKKFRVRLWADATVDAVDYIEAATEQEAEEKAMARAKSGDLLWRYRGVIDGTESAEAAEEVDSHAF